MNKQQDEIVHNYQALKKKPRSEEALNILKRLASQVKPILKCRQWTIKNLCEFFPTNPNLLGVNVNRGWKINLRLRPHFDDSQFMEYEDILGTLLHEIVYIVRGPHDEIFYKLLDELKQETEILMASGYRGEGFYSDGHQLGSSIAVPRYLSKQLGAIAAEKRLQHANIMVPVGGVRLGGSSSPLLKNMTPAQRAASAAEKRLRDKIWCGGSIEHEGDSPSSSAATSPTPSTSSSVNNKRRLNGNNASDPIEISNTTSKKSRVTIDLTDQDEDEIKSINNDVNDTWTCPLCTFINKPLLLACQICFSERPFSTQQPIIPSIQDETSNDETTYWKCPQCTLLVENKWTACTACTYINLK